MQTFTCAQLDKYIVQAAEVTPEELFDKFRAIVDMYILAGSELEVNIETAMRNKVLKVITFQDACPGFLLMIGSCCHLHEPTPGDFGLDKYL